MTSQNDESKSSRADELLAHLQADFLAELGERIDKLEDLTMAYEKGHFAQADFDSLFRAVHSLKGSAGTFGFPIASAVCHAYEDYLNSGRQSNASFAANCLKYIDLLRTAAEKVMQGRTEFADIEDSIRRLSESHFAKPYSAILVEPSKLTAELCKQAVSSLPIRLVQANDGLQALTRLLSEPFDLLISSQEVPTLNGTALIAAIRLANRPGQPIKTVLLTSQPGRIDAPIQPDHIVRKDLHLGQNLMQAVTKVLGLKT